MIYLGVVLGGYRTDIGLIIYKSVWLEPDLLFLFVHLSTIHHVIQEFDSLILLPLCLKTSEHKNSMCKG